MPLSVGSILLLVLGGFCGSAIASFAGGGGIVLLPLLIFSGLNARDANMTGTVAVLPGLIASSWAFRHVLRRERKQGKWLLETGLLGGLVGALLLLGSPAPLFGKLVPYLLALATAAFIYGTWFMRVDPLRGHAMGWGQRLALAALAVYGGYWGGGVALMTMGVMAISGWNDLDEMNALKSLFAAATNVAGVLLYGYYGQVHWQRALYLAIGTTLGGFLGAKAVQRMDPRWVRLAVAAYALGMTLYFFAL